MSGVMARSATSVPLTIYPTTLADYSAGMHLVQGILLALLQRERTGRGPEGQRVAVRLDARDADAGSGHASDARARK